MKRKPVFVSAEKRAILAVEIERTLREQLEDFPDSVVEIVGGGEERWRQVRKQLDEILADCMARVRNGDH